MMPILNFNVSKDFRRQSISILLAIVSPLAVSICNLELMLHSQVAQEAVSLHHENNSSHSEDYEEPPYHSHSSSHHDETRKLCCSQILAIRHVKSPVGPFAAFGPLELPLFVLNPAELCAKPKQFQRGDVSPVGPPLLVPKENSYFLAFPSHAPPSSV